MQRSALKERSECVGRGAKTGKIASMGSLGRSERRKTDCPYVWVLCENITQKGTKRNEKERENKTRAACNLSLSPSLYLSLSLSLSLSAPRGAPTGLFHKALHWHRHHTHHGHLFFAPGMDFIFSPVFRPSPSALTFSFSLALYLSLSRLLTFDFLFSFLSLSLSLAVILNPTMYISHPALTRFTLW